MYIKAAADTELEKFSKKVNCDRKILIATICEKDITDRGKVSGISLGFIMILRYFAQIMLEKKTLFWASGMLAILITYLILLTILRAEFIQTYKGFFGSVT